jgi:DNA ligase-1
MLLAELVAASDIVAATPSRTAKVAALADVLARCEPDELPVAVAALAGEARQGRIGVGWAVLRAVDPPAAARPCLRLADLDRALDAVAAATGPGSGAVRVALLTELLGRATAVEGSFVRCLLSGEVRHGALGGLVTDAVARSTGVTVAAVRRATMLGGGLPATAVLARTGGEPALAAVTLVVGIAIAPMLAAPGADVADALAAATGGTGLASVEWKLDGARIQAHRAGDTVVLYTRNGNDVTARLPGVVDLVRGLPATAVVLDGEVLGLDDTEGSHGETAAPALDAGRLAGADATGRPRGRFQDTMAAFGAHDGVAGAALVARFFDCLHLDGDDLLDRPLTERTEALERVAAPWRVPATLTATVAEAEAVLADALAAGHEGVVIKGAASRYAAGRRGGSWRKVKPVRTLDLVVLAAEWGHGRRTGWLSNLHLGARDPAGGPSVMVGKTFKGLTDELLAWQTTALRAIAVRASRGTVWVRPELVVEIALDGVQTSTRYPGGVALRFARVKRYRPDKEAADADTIDAVRALGLPASSGVAAGGGDHDRDDEARPPPGRGA